MSGILVKKVVTEEGEVIPYYMKSIDFGVELDGGEDFFQMFWPTIISHKIGGNVLEIVCVSFYVNKILNLVDKVLIVPSQTKSRPCMKSPRETSQQRCNSKSFSLWRASPQRQATLSRYNMLG